MSDKRDAILKATLNLVSENGFHGTPMSKIAKEAGVSAGIISTGLPIYQVPNQ